MCLSCHCLPVVVLKKRLKKSLLLFVNTSLSLSLSIQVYSDISSRAWQFHSFEKEIENDGKLFEIESSFLQQEFSSKENMSENKLV